MKHFCFRFFFLLFVSTVALSSPGAQFQFPGQVLTVPDGFEVELVAASPLVERPVSGSFDEQGRLYVTDSSGSNEKPDKQLAEKPHRVLMLEDTKGTGKFDKVTVFADKMMFPEGCLYHDGSVYVSAPPSIWKLTDTNHDGIADLREEWHLGKTLTGCANDLHGPFLGPDGWIYWCKGAFAEQTYDLPGKKAWTTHAAHIFRAPVDHSMIEPVLTGGMDNPVGVAFTAGGERILAGTFFAPGEPGHRDGLIHAIYGGVYGKVNAVTDNHPKTGELMPVMTHLGPAAPCGIIRYESGSMGDDLQDNLFTCLFNLRKVIRSVMVPAGATFTTKDSDFLTSDNPDFHPTDVIEDADGSLLVFNTGGWYKICCPTSQLSKPDVLGGIYRIRRSAKTAVDDPRGLKLSWATQSSEVLVGRLGDPRPAVHHRAIQELARLGGSAVPALGATLKESTDPIARCNAVWALTRIPGVKAWTTVREALKDKGLKIQQAALESISLHRDASALPVLLEILKKAEPSSRRLAAEALGRIGDKKVVPDLLRASASKHDRILEHSTTFALIELADPIATQAGLRAASVFEKRTALIALDQMPGGNLGAKTVAPYLADSDALLRRTAAWILRHHPDWGSELTDFFRQRLSVEELPASEAGELRDQLAEFSSDSAVQEIMAQTLVNPGTKAPLRRVVLEAIAQSSVKQTPPAWKTAVETTLQRADELEIKAAINAARTLSQNKTNAPNFAPFLIAIGTNTTKPADLRLEALAATPKGLPSVSDSLFQFLCASLDSAKPVSVRSSAVTVLARARLKDDQLLALTDTIRSVGPLEMTRLLPAFSRATNEAIGLRLVAALKDSKGVSTLRSDQLSPITAKFPKTVQAQAAQLLATLNVDAGKQKEHIEKLLAGLKGGDIRRGQTVFNSQKAACSTCHSMGYLGGHVGPDLTSIGTARTERDLLESIVYPSASFVRSFEPYIVTTKSDDTYTGVIKKDAADEIVLATGPTTETRLARSDIAEMRPGAVSIMPAGLDQQLTKQELADLVTFLKSTKWGPK